VKYILALALVLGACVKQPPQETPIVEKGIIGQDELPDWVTIITDQQTKCQYLVTAGGNAMTLRYGRGGRPMCETTSVQ